MAESVAATMTVRPRIKGTARTSDKCSSTAANCPKPEPAERVSGDATPNMMSSCETNIMPPMPQENPVTTACGTLAICRPRRTRPKPIRITDATMESRAAPPIPWLRTAKAMNGTVALAVPPISTWVRPIKEITGAVRMEVKIPSTGGNPMADARASP